MGAIIETVAAFALSFIAAIACRKILESLH
jgi:hypothetical protein